MQGCQWQFYGVTQIKTYFCEERVLSKKVWGTSLLPQVILVFSIKPISSSISSMLANLQSWASPQISPQGANPQLRTNEKSCGHADLRTLAV